MKLAYNKIGKGEPLIILHGLYGSGDNWYSIGKALSSQFEVFLPDQRNHGKSPHSDKHSYYYMQKDLLEFYDSQKLTKSILLGHSMGGKTAMLFSLLHPERIEKLIIVDIAPKAYKSLAEYQSHSIEHLNILNAFRSVDLTGTKSRLQIEDEFSRFVQDKNTRNFLLKNLKQNNNSFYWAVNISAVGNFLPEMLDEIKIDKNKTDRTLLNFPTLFITGENSTYILESDKKQIKEIFPKAEFVTIFNAGHMLHVEQPRLFLESIKYFLEN